MIWKPRQVAHLFLARTLGSAPICWTTMSSMAEARKWIRDHKLKSIGGLWATGLLGSLAYQWTRPIPTQLKIIHSRVYAQALTLAALGLIAAVDLYDTRQQSDLNHERLTALEQQQMEKAHASGHTHKT